MNYPVFHTVNSDELWHPRIKFNWQRLVLADNFGCNFND